MNLFENLGIPTLVRLDPRLLEFLGPLASLVTTLLNGAAFLITILLVVRILIIAFHAITAFHNPEKAGFSDSGELLLQSVRSVAESFLVALVAFLVVAQGANLLYYFAVSIGKTLIVDPKKDYLPQFAGPFAGLVAAAQSAVSLGVIVLGAAIAIKKWWDALSATRLSKSGRGNSQFQILNDTIRDTAILAVAVVAAFIVVRYGPNIFFDILSGGTKLISTPSVID